MSERGDSFEFSDLKSKIYCLVKFGKKEHLESFRKGILYCRNLSFYKNSENQKRIFYDSGEGLAAIYQHDQVSLVIKDNKTGKETTFNKSNGLVKQVKISYNEDFPIFCSTIIHSGEWNLGGINEENKDEFLESIKPSVKMEQFGGHAAVILNGAEFNTRLQHACDKAEVSISHGPVKYLDFSQVSGSIPGHYRGFVKDTSYSYESEYRYIFHGRSLSDPLILNLGSLEDIIQILPFAELISTMGINL